MPRTTLRDKFLLSTAQTLANLASLSRWDWRLPKMSSCCVSRKHHGSDTIGQKTMQLLLQSIFCLTTLCSEGQKVVIICVEREFRESYGVTGNYHQVISPSMRGTEATDSAVQDSNDNGSYVYTQSLPPHGHSFSSVSQRESSAESAQHS